MKWLNDLVSGSVGEVVDSVGGAIDRLVTSDEERIKLKNELATIKADAEVRLEEETTKRWVADTNSDSWLAKNIRPLVLGWGVVSITLIAFTDGISEAFLMDKAYIDLFQVLLTTMVVAYFGSRGFEKVKGK